MAEAVSPTWYQRLLSENVAHQLKAALESVPAVVVANPRYFLTRGAEHPRPKRLTT